MRILIAPDSFKQASSAYEVANSLATGIRRFVPKADIECVPMADGGEGTVQALVDATAGQLLQASVLDPLGRPISAAYGLLGDGQTAVIEMAAASGLPLLAQHERNPLITSTYGTGQLILHAIEKGCTKLIIGIGGSATNDGGAGMAQALGIRLMDRSGAEIARGGGYLNDLARIDLTHLDKRLRSVHITVASDVNNPLLGPQGASYTFGPQKGANPAMVEVLDNNLGHFAHIVEQTLGESFQNTPGAGAAGGLGFGMMAFLGAMLRPGFQLVAEYLDLEAKIKKADLIITAEGAIDAQTLHGKVPHGVAQLAAIYQKPVIAVAGTVADSASTLYQAGIHCILPITERPVTLDEAIANTNQWLANAGERIMRMIALGTKLPSH